MRTIIQLMFVALAANSATGSLLAQEPATPPPASPKQDAKKPKDSHTSTPEQDVLKKWVGNWDATIESTGPDGKPVTSLAKAKVRLGYGGRWLITEFDGTFMGAPFVGQEVLGYDPIAKKYILNWIDSASTCFSNGEGAFDAKTNTMTLTVSSRDDANGKLALWRQVDVWKDADHHEWSIRATGKDGKEKIQMTIRYRRKG
jgi:hypothetical protein